MAIQMGEDADAALRTAAARDGVATLPDEWRANPPASLQIVLDRGAIRPPAADDAALALHPSEHDAIGGTTVGDRVRALGSVHRSVDADGTPSVRFVVERDIQPGEELLFNYGDSYWEFDEPLDGEHPYDDPRLYT